jgi:kinesin family protein 2/24
VKPAPKTPQPWQGAPDTATADESGGDDEGLLSAGGGEDDELDAPTLDFSLDAVATGRDESPAPLILSTGTLLDAPEEEDQLVRTHEALISEIMQEEENVIAAHRTQVDDMMELIRQVCPPPASLIISIISPPSWHPVPPPFPLSLFPSLSLFLSPSISLLHPPTQEMSLLGEVENPGSSIDEYVVRLDILLEAKLRIATELQERLKRFEGQLKAEESLSVSVKR